MKTIGQKVREAREAAKSTPAAFARTLRIGKAKLNQIEHDQPLVITDENRDKLAKVGITFPPEQLEQHNYIARACAKAKNWSADFRAKLQAGALPITPELQAAVDAVDKELAEKGTVGGIPVDTSKMVQPKTQLSAVVGKAKKPTKKVAAPKKAKPAQPTSRQGFLPGFLDQMGHVRIEEMVTELIYKRIQERVDAKLDELFGAQRKG